MKLRKLTELLCKDCNNTWILIGNTYINQRCPICNKKDNIVSTGKVIKNKNDMFGKE